MTNQRKIAAEQIKIKNLRLRVHRLANISQEKILDISEEFNAKVNKVYTLIEKSEEKIRELRKKDEDAEVPEELDYDFGIDWTHGETTVEVPVSFNKIEDAKEYLGEEVDIKFLE